MDDPDNSRNTKSQFELDREAIQDDMMEHRLSKENELRRKRGLPEIPYPKPEPISKEKKLKAYKEALRIAEIYLKPLNEDV